MLEKLPQKPKPELEVKKSILGALTESQKEVPHNIQRQSQKPQLMSERIPVLIDNDKNESRHLDTAIGLWEDSIAEERRKILVAEGRMEMDDESFKEMFGELAEHLRERIPLLIQQNQERIVELEALVLALKKKRAGLVG